MSSFNMNNMDASDAHTGSRVVPESGDYNVLISDASLSDNKRRTGQNANLTYTILDGNFQGSTIKEFLAVVNPKDITQNIARARAKAIQIVCGAAADNKGEIEELTGYSMRIRVLKEPSEFINDKGQTIKTFQTNVVNYMTLEGKNAKGEDVPAFVAPAETNSANTSGAANTGNVHSGQSSQTSGGSNDMDDEIPF